MPATPIYLLAAKKDVFVPTNILDITKIFQNQTAHRQGCIDDYGLHGAALTASCAQHIKTWFSNIGIKICDTTRCKMDYTKFTFLNSLNSMLTSPNLICNGLCSSYVKDGEVRKFLRCDDDIRKRRERSIL